MVHGKRGKRNAHGFTLKDINRDGKGNYYVYVWNKSTYDKKEVKEQRELRKIQGKNHKNYSSVKGWTSIGNYKKEETINKLYKHLISVYGQEVDRSKMIEVLNEKSKELDKKYH